MAEADRTDWHDDDSATDVDPDATTRDPAVQRVIDQYLISWPLTTKDRAGASR